MPRSVSKKNMSDDHIKDEARAVGVRLTKDVANKRVPKTQKELVRDIRNARMSCAKAKTGVKSTKSACANVISRSTKTDAKEKQKPIDVKAAVIAGSKRTRESVLTRTKQSSGRATSIQLHGGFMKRFYDKVEREDKSRNDYGAFASGPYICRTVIIPQYMKPTCFFNAVLNGLLNNKEIFEKIRCVIPPHEDLIEYSDQSQETSACPLITKMNTSRIKHIICKVLNSVRHVVSVNDFANAVNMRTRPHFIIPGGFALPTLRKLLTAIGVTYRELADLSQTPENASEDVLVFTGNKQSVMDLPKRVWDYVLDHTIVGIRRIKGIDTAGHLTAGVFDCNGIPIIIDSNMAIDPVDWTKGAEPFESQYLSLLRYLYPRYTFRQIYRVYTIYVKTTPLK